MNFPNIINTDCIPTTPPPPDPRCSDPAFALAHPDICSTTPVLRLKPGVLLTCPLNSVQFETFIDKAGVETQVTSGLAYSSSNNATAVVGVMSGNATGVSAGDATITVSYQGLTATASLTVVGTGMTQSCCDAQKVATMLVVDISKSMSQIFGSGYAAKEDYAKSIATRYASETNTQKDVIGLVVFDETVVTVLPPTADANSIQTAIAGLNFTQNDTGIGLALQSAVDALNAVTADVKAIVLFSDGEDKDVVLDDAPSPIAEEWKAGGGIIMCCGIRSHDYGFNLLNSLSTGGFFVNAYPSVADAAKETLSGLKGYICAGNCTPPGDVYEYEPAIDFRNFTNWNVTAGHVDLFGPGLYDLLPGNGFYVNMSSVISPDGKSSLVSKTVFSFVTGKTYRLSMSVAGNQRRSIPDSALQISIDNTFGASIISFADFTVGFQTYSFNFTVPAAVTGSIRLIANEVLIDNVMLDDVTDLINMFTDNFDHENLAYVPPACGVGTSQGSAVKNVPLPTDYDGTGFASLTGLSIGTTYTYHPQNETGDYAIDYGSGSLNHSGTFVATQTTATLAGFSGEPILDTLTYVGAIYYYRYAGCYGYGCLTGPPGDQLPDSSPLPDLESGYVPPHTYTSTKSATVFCPSGTVQVGGGNAGATATSTKTSIVSQADADAKATAQATSDANAALALIGCQAQYTSTQSYTAMCPVGQFGPNVTKSASATGLVSQADADSVALAAATLAANNALSCGGSNNLLPITGIGPIMGPATPYPSVQVISGKVGLTTKVTLSINGFQHQYCRQVAVLLRSPSGRTAVIFCGMGGPHTVSLINLVIDDAGATVLPDFNTPVAGTYKCSPYQIIVSFTLPAPAYSQQSYWLPPCPQPPYGLNLATFIGDSPNGSWSLWVASGANVDTGQISSWNVSVSSV